MNIHQERALVLIQQGRWELAQQELVQVLAQEPNNVMAHALLSHCFLLRENPTDEHLKRATEEAEESIRCDANYPSGHAALARAMLKRNRFKEANAAVVEAIRLSPETADFYVLGGAVEYAQARWSAALHFCELALQHDPQNGEANNLRAMTLLRMGRRVEAGATTDETLRRNPDDADAHANKGWTLLEQGKPEEAMNHFKEALRLEPQSKWARAGIVEAIKARSFIYALMLKYFFWMARFSGQTQMAIMIAGLLLRGSIVQFGIAHPQYALYCDIFIYAFFAFVIMTWVSVPLFNLVLRTHPLGKYALDREEIQTSNWIGLCFFSAAAIALWSVYSGNTDARELAVHLAVLAIPIVATFSAPPGNYRLLMGLATVGFAAIAGTMAYLSFTFTNANAATYVSIYQPLSTVFAYGIIITSYVTGYLRSIPRRK